MSNWFRIRVGFSFFLFLCFLSAVAFRLTQLQVLPNSELEKLGERQFKRNRPNALARSAIVDRNGEELALTVSAGSVFARPKVIRKKHTTARQLARILGGSQDRWLQKLNQKKSFVWLQRQVTQEAAEKIRSEKLRGIYLEPGNKRFYPNETLAANVLGFTNIDGNGIEGVELELNDQLLNDATGRIAYRDGKGNLTYIEKPSAESIQGRPAVHLSLDRRVQSALEEELDRALADTGGKSVMGVVMDPHTGEVLAMGQRPTYDPNQASQLGSPYVTNRMISHLYEPGSTIKVLLAAEAMEKGLMSSKSLLDCGKGEIQIGNKRIREAEADHRYGILPLEKVIRYSSNVGAIRVAQQLGTTGVRDALTKFGLFNKTGIHLPGETSSSLRPESQWNPFLLATVGFGQGIAVTPLQAVAAFAPFANGGYRVRPKILLSELESDARELPQRILSPQTILKMKEILVSVTEGEKGTGSTARIPGIRVAGKTGTAQKYDQATGGYGEGKYFSSFIGFLPADNPSLLIGVFVDEPKGSYYGTTVAAPVFKRVGERSLSLLDKLPRVVAARAVYRPVARAVAPPPRMAASSVKLEMIGQHARMPDLKGMSLREVMKLLGTYSKEIRVAGSGYCETQIPPPGTIVSADTSLSVSFTN